MGAPIRTDWSKGLTTDEVQIWFNSVSPGYFETLRTPLLDGRDFTAGDTEAGLVDIFSRYPQIRWLLFNERLVDLMKAFAGDDFVLMPESFAILNSFGRFILVATRSVHTMVWALFFVALFGPGALAGTLAIAVHSIGFTGKFLSEALEEAKVGPIEALTAAGAPPLAILIKGYWPQVKPAFLAIAAFRWDINVRESAVLGLVGAGGIGMTLDSALNLFQWNRVATILAAIFAIVILAEVVVTFVRKRIL